MKRRNKIDDDSERSFYAVLDKENSVYLTFKFSSTGTVKNILNDCLMTSKVDQFLRAHCIDYLQKKESLKSLQSVSRSIDKNSGLEFKCVPPCLLIGQM